MSLARDGAVPRRLIQLDAAAALGIALVPELLPLRHALGGDPGSATVWSLSLAAALPLAVRRLWPVPVLLSVLVVALVSLPFGLAPTAFLAVAYALYLVAVVGPQPRRLSAVVVGGVCAVGAAALTMTGSPHYPGGTRAVQVVFGLLVLGATWSAGSAVRERRARLRQTIEQAAERAKAEERLRIARDIHDVVTHSVGLIAVKAGIANHVAVTNPEEAQQALTVIEDVSRKALRDLRATLTLLRREEGPEGELRPVLGLADLPELVRTADAAGVRVALEVDCQEPPPDGVALSAFRIVQEALTNVVKHAAPTGCRVRVTVEQQVITIDVDDDGPRARGSRAAVPGGGLGLVGMRERAAAHGGVLTAGPRPGGGFQVSASLPF
ncbi:sensor histidine kinase [Streptacidiphilus anmyonensis]|uniref:sensor histidine kinase n=1 Tax=Streptacidiphilus anmyonensis TaxID=405782 RepID=UPI0005AB402B|nr:sensor histidine kinase [Streptacidiphilus anmyonensis]